VTRFAFLLAASSLFWCAPYVLPRSARIHPTWRTILGVVTLAGMLLTLVSLLVAILFPEVLLVHHLTDIWKVCTAALRRFGGSPFDHVESTAAGALLALMFVRVAWVATTGLIANHRARVHCGRVSHRL